MGTIIGASNVDNEDIIRMCTDLTKQACRRKFDQEGFPAWGDISEEEDTEEEVAREDAIATGGRRGSTAVATIARRCYRSGKTSFFSSVSWMLGIQGYFQRADQRRRRAITMGKKASCGEYCLAEEKQGKVATVDL